MTAPNDGESKNSWEEHLREEGFPRRITIDRRNKYWERWERFFEKQYKEECARLGITSAPKQTTLL